MARSLDDAELSVFHLRSCVTAGAGFFTDSYDLNVIGTATLLITPQFHLDSGQVSMLTSSTLLATAFGAFGFGRLGDVLGRRRIYGLEALLMILGALVSALSPNFTVLLIGRLILGIGIGGDYPASGVIMAEYANRSHRGRLIGLTFIFYTFGSVAAYLVSLIVLAVGVPHDTAWRVILGVGVLPSLLVLYQRRHMPESPRWTADRGDPERAAQDLEIYARRAVAAPADTAPVRGRASASTRAKEILASRGVLVALLGAAGSWFFYDVAAYGISVSQPLLIDKVVSGDSILSTVALSAVLAVCFSLTAAVVGIYALDRMPRRKQGILGLVVYGVMMGLIAIVPALSAAVVPFVLLFGIAQFGNSFGPSYSTVILPAECFPTSVRSTCHGFSAGMAKVGAFIGALVVPLILDSGGLRVVTAMVAGCALLAIAGTLLLREPSGVSLDEVSDGLIGSRARASGRPLAESA